MTIPRTKEKVLEASNEIVSGISALNMPPQELENPPEDARYLSELDFWAKHSVEHFRAALQLLNEVYLECDELILKNNLLKEQLRRKRNEERQQQNNGLT